MKPRGQAVKLSVLWAKTGLRELSMRDAVNDYIEATGANHAINNDEQAILYGRRAVALRVSIEAINSLNKDELQRLDRKLMEIVSEDMPRQQHEYAKSENQGIKNVLLSQRGNRVSRLEDRGHRLRRGR